MRLLYIIILLAVSYLVVKSFLNKLEQNKKIGKGDTHPDSSSNNNNDKAQMLKCEECGLHVPADEAIRQGNHIFCSLEHARQRLE